MNRPLRSLLRHGGFTLLEMLLVLFIMALVASTATLMTEGVDTQAQYDDTRRRMELVRHAIAGDTRRTVNGVTELGGFVADMGREPACLAELLEPGSETSPATVPRTFLSPCGDSAVVTEWHADAATGLWTGWRGPYLQGVAGSGGKKIYPDGFGNPGPAPNYGWTFSLATDGTVGLTSRGAKTADAGDDVSDPALVVPADTGISLSLATVSVHNRRGSDSLAQNGTLVLRLYYPDGTAVVQEDSASFSLPALAAGQSMETIVSFATPWTMPIGVRGFAIVCAASGVLFDGDCDALNPPPAAGAIRTFAAVPRVQPASFAWTLL